MEEATSTSSPMLAPVIVHSEPVSGPMSSSMPALPITVSMLVYLPLDKSTVTPVVVDE